jgi:imidazole glycerol-phosphate synthase subunit HisF
MIRPRLIPCLLMQNGGLVKTYQFKAPVYLGDPLNAVKIFNEKKADELIFLDIDASVHNVEPDYKLIKKLASECRMPLCYGGGISKPDQAIRLIDMGVEKIAMSSAAIAQPNLVEAAAKSVGSQSVVVVLDVFKKSNFLGTTYQVKTHNGKVKVDADLFDLIKRFQDLGAGEIVINSINNDGVMQGYDLEFIAKAKALMNVPITLLGGAGSFDHFLELFNHVGLVGAGAGSFFVFKGKYRAVLISYPSYNQKKSLFPDMNYS